MKSQQKDSVQTVQSTLQKHDFDPRFLTLEIDESILLNNMDETIQKLW
ncbi:hypothetical protein [Peribacillus kribbensis]|nr:hypothetical protein [Peribacillus kribbensis]